MHPDGPLRFSAMSPAYRGYALFLLWLASVISYLDRHILSVLLEPIRHEFGFSDTQLGLLGGVAFAVFYVLFAFPVARITERGDRRMILAIAVGLWSVAAAACGAVSGFVSLFVARAAVAVGEAGGGPAIQSLMADHVPPARRGGAFAILGTAITASIFTAYVLGGWLAQQLGWRLTFVAVALPGLLVSLLVWFTLKEPERGGSEGRLAAETAPPFGTALRLLWARPAFRWVVLAGAIAGMGAWGSGVWLASFLVRVHGMSIAQAGGLLGVIFGVCGTAGTLAGGLLSDRLIARTGRTAWSLRAPALLLAAAVPLAAIAYTADALTTAVTALAASLTLFHAYSGPWAAAIQGLAELRTRATATAVALFANSLVSMGLGPLVVGAASDLFGAQEGGSGLRYALLFTVTLCYALAAICFWMASRTLQADMVDAARG
jgi:predicted MFS family arabinose efflux permease